MISLEQVVARLEALGCGVKRTRRGFAARCPAHGDERDRHLYVERGDRTEVVVHCFRGCSFEAIVTALGFSPGDVAAPESRFTEGEATIYSYHWMDETVAFQEVRRPVTDPVTGEEKKSVRLRRPNRETGKARGRDPWIWDLEGIEPPPFRLPGLIRANPNLIVAYAEGPKCAEVLAKSGYPATTTAFGAGAAKRTPDLPYWLKGRLVAIYPDYDVEGWKHAREVEAWLNGAGFGITAKVIELPGLSMTEKHGADVADWIEAGLGDAAAALVLAEAAFAVESHGREERRRMQEKPVSLTLSPLAYVGVAERVVNVLAPISEAELAPILVNFLLAWGCMIGRSAHARVGATRHYLNEFALLVGPTGGGKGGSWDPVRWLLSKVEPVFAQQGIHKGLSSGEGLVALVRDRKVKPKAAGKNGHGRPRGLKEDDDEEEVEDEGVADKRKLVVEEEFASVLAVMRRQGNTLSARLREAFDDGYLEIVTKERTTATKAHIAIIGHITPEEMRERLSEEDAGNGFGNRFLLVATSRRQLLPHGAKLPVVGDLVAALRLLYEGAAGAEEIERTPAAAYMWEQIYGDLKRPKEGLFGKMVERRAAHVLRLSAIYATLTGTLSIGPEELLAALAVWTYCEKTAWSLFGTKVGVGPTDRLLTEVRARTGMTRSVMYEFLNLRAGAKELDAMLGALEGRGLIYSERKLGDGGRDVEMWFAEEVREVDDSNVYLGRATAAYEEVQAAGGVPAGWEPALWLEVAA